LIDFGLSKRYRRGEMDERWEMKDEMRGDEECVLI